MAEDSCWLHLNWCYFSNGLYQDIVGGQFPLDVLTFSNYDHLDNDIGFFLRAQTTVQWV